MRRVVVLEVASYWIIWGCFVVLVGLMILIGFLNRIIAAVSLRLQIILFIYLNLRFVLITCLSLNCVYLEKSIKTGIFIYLFQFIIRALN